MHPSESFRAERSLRIALHAVRLWLSATLVIAAAAKAATPRDIFVVLDVSQNMAEADRFVVAGAHLATFELAPSDRVAVISAASHAKWHSGLTGKGEEIEHALRSAQPGVTLGRSAFRLFDAAVSVLERVPGTDDGRERYLVLITNQTDQGSAHLPEEVIREAKRKHVAVHAFLVRDPSADTPRQSNGYPHISHADVQLGAEQLRPIAEATDGSVTILDGNGYVLRKAIATCKGDVK